MLFNKSIWNFLETIALHIIKKNLDMNILDEKKIFFLYSLWHITRLTLGIGEN